MNIPGTRYEGPLERKLNKWKEFHVVLNSGQLLFYKDRTSDPRDGLLGTLKLSVTTFCNSSSGVLTRGYQFSVSTPEVEAHLRSNTSEQRDKWIKEIMGSVTELNDYNRMISMRPAQIPHPEPQVYDSTLVVNMSPEHEWYWPGKTRDQAEQLLKQVDSNHFLVRDSGHEPGSYSLSVRVSNADNMVIFHYIIKRDHAENKFILVPAPGKRFDTLEHVVGYYLHLNKDVGLQPLKNPSYKPPVYDNNATLPTPMTQNPTSHSDQNAGAAAVGKQEGGENEYVRLGKFPSAKQQQQQDNSYEVDGGKAPVKPTRPSINRPAQSDYMNVTTQPPPQDVINSGPSGGGGNYIYAHVGVPGSAPPPGMESGDKIMIRGAPRSTPAVANFADMGTPINFSGRTSTSLFEDSYSAPIPASTQSGENNYVNCELSNQVSSVSISDPRSSDHSERPKSSGMSKSSAKAGKNKMAKAAAAKNSQISQSGTAPQYGYKNQYPPANTGMISYNDPCLSMTTPPTPKNKTVRDEADLFPAPSGPMGYTDPALSMSTAPPSKAKQGSVHTINSQFPVAAGPQGYTDPSIAMSKPPSKIRGANRHNGV
ncbi:hypothetical protein ACHWQZ_G011911 [Mnemiopsis leidyi]